MAKGKSRGVRDVNPSGESIKVDSPFRERWGARIDGKADEKDVYSALDVAAKMAEQQGERDGGRIRFLLDECVSPLLQAVAEEFGYHATFIDHLGWRTLKDHQLLPRLIEKDLVLVTNNREDWIALLGNAEAHPGLVVIRENVPRARQISYFAQCLIAIYSLDDMVNTVVEVDRDDVVTVYALPPQG